MSISKVSSISMRAKKINTPSQVAKAAGGSVLIPKGFFLFPMEWCGKKIIQSVHVFRNMSTPLILGIDGIHNLRIAYLSRAKSFKFQDEVSQDE